METMTNPSGNNTGNSGGAPAAAAASVPVPRPDRTLPLLRQADHLMSVYGRHFTGRPRASRDLLLIDEIAAGLGDIRQKLLPQEHWVAANLRQIDSHLALLAEERRQIDAARGQGTPAERSQNLLQRVAEQFAWYRIHFSGRPRLSRRPALLARICAALDELRVAMSAAEFADVADGGEHDRQRDLVEKSLVELRRELRFIELEHQTYTLAERIDSLGAAANDELTAYRTAFSGKDRSARDMALLGRILDRLTEVEAQMMAILLCSDNLGNTRNVEIVQRSLDRLEVEYHALASSLALAI